MRERCLSSFVYVSMVVFCAACGPSSESSTDEGPTAAAREALVDVSPPSIMCAAAGDCTLTPTVDSTNGPATVTLGLHLTDAPAGFSQGTFFLSSPTSAQGQQWGFTQAAVSGTVQDGVFQAVATVPQFAESGTWFVEFVYLADAAGNHKTYYQPELQTFGVPTTVNVVSNTDVTPPSIVCASAGDCTLTPTVDATNGPATVTLRAHLTDAPAGFSQGTFYLSSPTSAQGQQWGFSQMPLSGTVQDGIFQASAIVPPFSESGTWSVGFVFLRDVVGNHKTYYQPELQALGFPTTMNVVSNTDNTPPSIACASAGDCTLTPTVNVMNGPATVTLSVHLTDAPAGFNHGTFYLSSPTSVQGQQWVFDQVPATGTLQDGVFQAVATVPQFAENGTWFVGFAFLADAAGNHKTYYRPELQALGVPTTVNVVSVCASSSDCAARDQCHLAGICDTATGACSNPPKPDGATCNDGDACTQADSCQAGVCAGASPVTCAALDQCHLAGSCTPGTGQCSNPPVPNGAPIGGSAACNTGKQGICAAGITACTAGAVVCNQTNAPTTETCDGLDNDCNGVVDNGNPSGGAACSTGQLGVCAAGTTACTSGAIVCNRNTAPSTETCDGLDNDCNGVVDNGNPGGAVACSTGQLGICSAGTTACSSGALVCNQTAQPSAETCNGIDDNCDGVVDNGVPGCGSPICITLQRGPSGSVADALIATSAGSDGGPTANFGASSALTAGGVVPGQRQALLRFDLSAIPASATIQSATVTLHVLLNGGAPVRAHRVLSPWSESTVTWASFASAYAPTVVATFPGTSTTSASLVPLVQAWVSGAAPNDGILLERDLTGSTVFASSEAQQSLRPTLDICYLP